MEEKEYRRVPIPPFERFDVARDGTFRMDGIPYKLYTSHGTRYIVSRRDGKRVTMNAAKAVASAWIDGYAYPGELARKNGKKYDISADNLLPCSEHALSVYYGQISRRAIRYIERVNNGLLQYSRAEKEVTVCRRLIESGDCTELSEYIRENMLDREVDRVMSIYDYSRPNAMRLVVNAVAVVIERVSCGEFVTSISKAIREEIRTLRKNRL